MNDTERQQVTDKANELITEFGGWQEALRYVLERPYGVFLKRVREALITELEGRRPVISEDKAQETIRALIGAIGLPKVLWLLRAEVSNLEESPSSGLMAVFGAINTALNHANARERERWQKEAGKETCNHCGAVLLCDDTRFLCADCRALTLDERMRKFPAIYGEKSP